jgi:vancomycin resistance protein YoaR
MFFTFFNNSRALAMAALLSFFAMPAIFAMPAFAQLPAPALGEKKPAADEKAPPSTPALPPAARDGATHDDAPARGSTPAPKPMPKPRAPLSRAPLSIGGVSIRGLNDLEVIQTIREEFDDKLRANLELWDGESAHRLSRKELGASIPYFKLLADARALSDVGGDVPLRFEVDLEKAKGAMKNLASQINRKPAAESLSVDGNGKVVYKGGGAVSMAIEGSALRVKAALENNPPQNYAELVVARRAGKDDLSRFKYLLAEYSTPYNAGQKGRTVNLKMSAKLVNGEIVAPGKVFSTNLAIGPRNAANGWKEAKMFVSGQVVDGVGAGICQTATTIYNAALLANLPIVERHPHSFRVNYAPASRDATIYWGQKDMKFRNNTSGPIYVQTFLTGKRFYVRLYGVEPVRENVTIESKVLSRNNGTRSEAYRVVETGANRKREFLSRDYYKPSAH